MVAPFASGSAAQATSIRGSGPNSRARKKASEDVGRRTETDSSRVSNGAMVFVVAFTEEDEKETSTTTVAAAARRLKLLLLLVYYSLLSFQRAACCYCAFYGGKKGTVHLNETRTATSQ